MGVISLPLFDKLRASYYNGDMDNLILIGMPAAGKSTAGVLLAKRIGYGFIDCDLIIQNEEQARLGDIIEQKGPEGFLAIEERVNLGLYATRCVIATGGSVCYSPAAMEHLKKLGKIIYLEVAEEEIERRIRSFERRGVVMRGNVKSIKQLYDERVPLYEKYADFIVDCNSPSIDENVETLAAAAGFTL